MALRTVAVIARKGGAGKTTVSIHLALAAYLRGQRTLLADMDPQRSALEVFKARKRAGPDRMESTGAKLFALKTNAARQGVDTLVVDTPAGDEAEMASAIALSDLCVIVVRPTYLDIAAALQSVEVVRRLRKAAVLVVNQAQSPRRGVELPAMERARRALELLGLPVCPVMLRTRAAYQNALERGFSVEESDDPIARQEIGELWRRIDQMVTANLTCAQTTVRPPVPEPATSRAG